jgi:predicted DNA-binding transcriptional regulator AlpA
MRAEQAAAYLSISKSMFFRLVEEGVMPPPIKIPGHSITTWDRHDLDAAYDNLKQPYENTVHKRLRELEAERLKGGPVKVKERWSPINSRSYRDPK